MSTPGKATIKKVEYKNYIKSLEWQQKKKDYFNSKLPKDCYICGDSKSKKDLHHRTYKNLGNERLMDLVPVCRKCHFAIHDHSKRTGDDLWKSTTKLRQKFKKHRIWLLNKKQNSESLIISSKK